MTKKEAHEYLKNSKIFVDGKSAQIQKKLLEAGFKWTYVDPLIEKDDMSFLYVHGDIISDDRISVGASMIHFSKSYFKELKADDILAIEIQEEKPKHDEEMRKLAQPIQECMRKHNISGSVVISQFTIAVEDMRFIYPNNSED